MELIDRIKKDIDDRLEELRPQIEEIPRLEAALAALEASGHAVRRWPARHHYFGGVSVVTRSGAAGDPRRSGAARALG